MGTATISPADAGGLTCSDNGIAGSYYSTTGLAMGGGSSPAPYGTLNSNVVVMRTNASTEYQCTQAHARYDLSSLIGKTIVEAKLEIGCHWYGDTSGNDTVFFRASPWDTGTEPDKTTDWVSGGATSYGSVVISATATDTVVTLNAAAVAAINAAISTGSPFAFAHVIQESDLGALTASKTVSFNFGDTSTNPDARKLVLTYAEDAFLGINF